jgi:hypothetical protein
MVIAAATQCERGGEIAGRLSAHDDTPHGTAAGVSWDFIRVPLTAGFGRQCAAGIVNKTTGGPKLPPVAPTSLINSDWLWDESS